MGIILKAYKDSIDIATAVDSANSIAIKISSFGVVDTIGEDE